MAEHHPRHIAEHEAAHVVVGRVLGLKLIEARIIIPQTPTTAGHTIWEPGERIALACMYGAGVVWDRMCKEGFSVIDAEQCRKHLTTNAAVGTCYRIAKDIILSRRSAHRMVTQALLAADDHRLTGVAVRHLALGLENE